MKMRDIGFVVGQTNWNRMLDPSGGSSALTKTKIIPNRHQSEFKNSKWFCFHQFAIGPKSFWSRTFNFHEFFHKIYPNLEISKLLAIFIWIKSQPLFCYMKISHFWYDFTYLAHSSTYIILRWKIIY